MLRRDFLRIGLVGLCSSAVSSGFNASAELYFKIGDSDTALFPFRSGTKGWWGFIDAAGQVVVSPETSRIVGKFSDFYGGLAAVRFDDESAWMIMPGARNSSRYTREIMTGTSSAGWAITESGDGLGQVGLC